METESRPIERRGGHRAALVSLAFALAAAGCEGGNSGGDSTPQPPGDVAAPAATVRFPPAGCLTDASQTTVVLTATDATGVAEVRVGGIAAVFEPSDSTWRAQVALGEGDNVFAVAARDTLGNQATQAAQVTVRRESVLWSETAAVAFDSLAGRALVLDPSLRMLFAVNAQTGARTPLSGPGIGQGPLWAAPRGVEFDANSLSALVTDGELDAVFRVDLATGLRTVLTSPSVGAGPIPFDLHGIVVDEPRNRALVVDDFLAAVLAVDLVTGARSTISSPSIGGGPPLLGGRGIALDLIRGRALVTALLGSVVLAVDLASGDRSLFTGGNTGTGSALVTPFDLDLDLAGDRAFLTDLGPRLLVEVDLTSGARRIHSGPAAGTGPDWLAPQGVAVDQVGAPLVVDRARDALVAVGLASGDRTILSGITAGSGPELMRPVALALSPASLAVGGSGFDRLYVVDAERKALVALDLGDGTRKVTSGTNVGEGPAFFELCDVVVSPSFFLATECIAVLDAGRRAILAVDQTTGNRSILSDGVTGQGPGLTGPRRMVFDPTTAAVVCLTRVLVVDKSFAGPAAIVRVDLVTGNRQILSDPTHGSGPDLVDPVGIDIDPSREVCYVLDPVADAIFRVDLATGNRTILSAPGAGVPLSAAGDLVYDAHDDRLLVADPGQHALLTVNPVTGLRTVVSDEGSGSGPFLARPSALELVRGLGVTTGKPTAYVTDETGGSVLAVELVSGDRTIRSK